MKKKIFSLSLSIILLFTALPFAVVATEEEYPVVIDSGYMTSQIFLFDDEGKIEDVAWYPDLFTMLKETLREIPGFIEGGLKYLKNKDTEQLSNELALSVANVLEKMKRHPDGTPVYNSGVWPIAPEESNMKYIKDNITKIRHLWGTIHEGRYMDNLCEKVGAENVFQFSVDWRQEIIFCARDLGKYIKSVLDYTGAKKVNILSESHGGQTTGTYIALCSMVGKGGKNAETLASLLSMKTEDLKTYFNLDYINNAVLNSPAIGGVQITYDFLSGKSHVDLPQVIEFAQAALNPLYFTLGGNKYVSESDFELLLSFIKLDLLNKVVDDGIQTDRFSSVILSFGSVWDFVEADHYDEIKEMYINTPVKQKAFAPMLERTDFSHYTIMPNLNEYLTYAREKGVNVNIICGTDISPATGSAVNSDCIVATKTASGAKLSDCGSRFSDGYKTNVDDPSVKCKNASHNHVSPRMNLDAAYGYLPENTWYIDGQFHAQYAYDSYALVLTDKLLLTSDLKDVRSDIAFPQFEATYNAKYAIHAAFDKSEYGRASSDDSALIIKNLSEKSNIEIVAIKVNGADIAFENATGKIINQGSEITVPLSSKINEEGRKNFTVTVYYLEDNSTFALGVREFNFLTVNDKNAEYDESNPQTKVHMKPVYVSADDVKTTLSNFGFDVQIKAFTLIIRRIFNILTFSVFKTK
ncbi:MAG: hypothetical protein Q4D20_03545 [Clostridia bacterium]|nr:hypothetical protein [Clostridia bacterium]